MLALRRLVSSVRPLVPVGDPALPGLRVELGNILLLLPQLNLLFTRVRFGLLLLEQLEQSISAASKALAVV